MKEKIWGIVVQLTTDNRYPSDIELQFDDSVWNYILEESVKTGINTIILELGSGIEFGSHPEIATKGAWTRKKVRTEVRRCKELGIALIPKLNFSTAHDLWLGEYAKMVSTTTYYQVCNDLIKEAYTLFGCPEYIHLGFDEEDARHVQWYQLPIYRQKELFWHDLNFLMDCVADTGARPWIWSCPLFRHVEEYKAHVGVKDAVLSPWYYHAFHKEHWTPVNSRPEYIAYYGGKDFAHLNLEYVEEDPYNTNFRKVALPLLADGYEYVPCASVYNKCDYNTFELVEYFKENAPDEQILGYITAPWVKTLHEEGIMRDFAESFRLLKEAKDQFYG